MADHTAPETFMGVPVPRSLAHDWDHVHAIWWRYGVRAAVTNVVATNGSSAWRFAEDTNPEEGIKE